MVRFRRLTLKRHTSTFELKQPIEVRSCSNVAAFHPSALARLLQQTGSMRFLFFLVVMAALFVVWKKQPPAGHRSDTLITYTSNADLISKLRQVKNGTQLDLRFAGSTEPISTGIRCSDHAAIAAYQERMERQLQIERQLIEAEMVRINETGLRH